MKVIQLLIAVCVGVLMQSCYKSGTIRVQNRISQVKIMDVRWGDNYIATELLPGQTSSKRTIDKNTEKLPSGHKVSFKMTANNKTIYLETEDTFLLNEDDDLLIVLTDDTKVKNPNE